MRVFDIYEHPSNGLRAIKRGFSWSAFLAPPVWSAARGLGSTTLLLVICSTLMFDVLKLASGYVPDSAMMLTLFVASYAFFGIKPGTEGNSWHANSLLRDGYERRFVIAARSRRQAMRALRSGQLNSDAE